MMLSAWPLLLTMVHIPGYPSTWASLARTLPQMLTSIKQSYVLYTIHRLHGNTARELLDEAAPHTFSYAAKWGLVCSEIHRQMWKKPRKPTSNGEIAILRSCSIF